jgi:hypothetical protein
MTLSIITFSILTFSIMTVMITINKSDNQHNETQNRDRELLVMFSIINAECKYTECHYLSVFMLSVVVPFESDKVTASITAYFLLTQSQLQNPNKSQNS